jgi:signal transduction histidine kinase
MSHELRTPLNAIIGFSEIIRDEAFGPVGSTKYSDYANDINDSGQHLLGLINDILDLAKIESGADELYEEQIDIEEFVRSVMTLVGRRAEEGEIRLTWDLPEDLPALRADNRKLKQILVNLLSNAIKFTPAGGQVTLKALVDKDGSYEFRVSDTGIGIAADDIPKALSKFGQVDAALNRQYEGTGLGLPLTKALVEIHGGNLDLESEVGVGTTATARFPAERVVLAVSESHAAMH